MPRFIENTAVLGKIEATYGLDSVPTGGANAIDVSAVTINALNAQNVDRALLRPYFGASEQLVGTAYKTLDFSTEIAGSGSKGVAPAFGPLLRASGLAQIITATSLVEYQPVSSGFDSATLYAYDDGIVHKLLGSRGTFDADLGLGKIPKFAWKFMGLDGGDFAAQPGTVDYAAVQVAQVVTDANSGDIMLGGSYAAGVLSGGTLYGSTGLTFSLGARTVYTPLLGSQSVDVTGREVTGTIQLDLTAAQEVDFLAKVRANTRQSLGFSHGTLAGRKVVVFMPAVQLINPRKTELNNRRMQTFDFRAVPVNGNDEIVIAFL
ncbi:hypothetical protein GN316_15345 [Xylophilus sp. Kf1]|nr:hypothetical protein [Xylophilus sp. Kf1]